ncbi:sugar dehydrogenase [Citrobacter freundii]|nr:sugar dehydrogenase [Citrobacter freundii]
MDGSQKLPQRLLDPIRLHLAQGDHYRRLALGVAGWMRYVSGIDEKGNSFEVVDPMAAQFRAIYQKYKSSGERVRALLAIDTIFGQDLRNNPDFIEHVTAACQQLHSIGARAAVASLSH